MTNHHTTRTSPVIAIAAAALASIVVLAAAGPAPAQTPAPAAKATTAAAPAPALDAILKDLTVYDGGIKSEAVWKLRDYVLARRDDAAARADCEAKLVAYLKITTSSIARMAVARLLRPIASDTSVPALAALLADERTADAAIFVLQQIPGAAAEQAFIKALPTATGAVKIAVVAALGERRDPAAAPALVPLLQVPALAKAAAYSLGKIGGDEPAKALMAARTAAPADAKAAVNAALMQCAEASLAAKDTAGAQKIYEVLAADTSLAASMREAAVIGRINSAGANAAAVLVDALGGSDAVAQAAAVARLRDIVPDAGIGRVCAVLPKLGDGLQVAVLAALSKYPAQSVVPAVLDRARAGTPAVRLAALKALETIGGAAEVPFLVQLASQTKGSEQAAARATLGMLHGRAADDAILAQLAQKPADPIAAELMLAAGERRVFTAKPLLAAALAGPSAPLRAQALKSLRTIGTPSDMPAVLDLLILTKDDAERAEAEKTISALGLKIASADGRARFVTQRLSRDASADARARLIGVLALLGDNTALPAVRAALASDNADVRDAAVRAFAAWPTAEAREDLMRLARDARDETHRLLAIAGLIRVIGLEPYRDPAAAVADLRLAAGFAWRPEEHKLVLGMLSQFPCREALDMASGFLGDTSVKAEAQSAVDKISARLSRESIRK